MATAAACLPILWAAVRASFRGWRPTGDIAYMALNAGAVFTRHPPLLGTWSSASQAAGRDLNHPGPLLFDFLAIPVKVFGPSAGTAIGMALVNVAAVLTIAWLVRRRLGPSAAILAMGASALLAWSIGSELLFDPWNPFAVLWAFAAFLVAGWCLASGDLVAAPVMAVIGSLVLQTHLSYSVLVPGMFAVAVVLAAATFVRTKEARPSRRQLLGWTATTVVVTLLTWAQPLYEQFVDHEGTEGNLTLLARSYDTQNRHPTLGQSIRAFGGTVALPPGWLPPSFGHPRYGGFTLPPPMWQAGGALLVLVVALGVLGWRAFRRGSATVAIGVVTAYAALVLGLMTITRMPVTFVGMQNAYGRFMWPLGMVVWLALAVALVDEVRARDWRTARGVAGFGLGLAIVGGVAALPTVDNGSQPKWTIDALDGLDDDMVHAIQARGGGPVLVEMPYHNTSGYIGPPLLYVLQDAGIDFFVTNERWARQFGTWHTLDDSEHPRLTATIVGGPFARNDVDGAREVAYWSELPPRQQAEYEDLTEQIRTILQQQGVVLTKEGQEFFGLLNDQGTLAKFADAKTNPERILGQTLIDLWRGEGLQGGPLLDHDVFPPEIMDPWVRYASQQDLQVAVYLRQFDERDRDT